MSDYLSLDIFIFDNCVLLQLIKLSLLYYHQYLLKVNFSGDNELINRKST